jgi:hypothetical protein
MFIYSLKFYQVQGSGQEKTVIERDHKKVSNKYGESIDEMPLDNSGNPLNHPLRSSLHNRSLTTDQPGEGSIGKAERGCNDPGSRGMWLKAGQDTSDDGLSDKDPPSQEHWRIGGRE